MISAAVDLCPPPPVSDVSGRAKEIFSRGEFYRINCRVGGYATPLSLRPIFHGNFYRSCRRLNYLDFFSPLPSAAKIFISDSRRDTRIHHFDTGHRA